MPPDFMSSYNYNILLEDRCMNIVDDSGIHRYLIISKTDLKFISIYFPIVNIVHRHTHHGLAHWNHDRGNLTHIPGLRHLLECV